MKLTTIISFVVILLFLTLIVMLGRWGTYCQANPIVIEKNITIIKEVEKECAKCSESEFNASWWIPMSLEDKKICDYESEQPTECIKYRKTQEGLEEVGRIKCLKNQYAFTYSNDYCVCKERRCK
jgi:hypothetical protein